MVQRRTADSWRLWETLPHILCWDCPGTVWRRHCWTESSVDSGHLSTPDLRHWDLQMYHQEHPTLSRYSAHCGECWYTTRVSRNHVKHTLLIYLGLGAPEGKTTSSTSADQTELIIYSSSGAGIFIIVIVMFVVVLCIAAMFRGRKGMNIGQCRCNTLWMYTCRWSEKGTPC